jgi:hypothetical protein
MSGKKKEEAAVAAAVQSLPGTEPSIQQMIRDATAEAMQALQADLSSQAAGMVDGIAKAITSSVAPMVKAFNDAAGETVAIAPSPQATKEWYLKLDKKAQTAVHKELGLVRGPTGIWSATVGHDLELILNGGGWGVFCGGLGLLGKASLPLGVWKVLNLLSVL